MHFRKDDEHKLKELMFIDMQLARLGSPASDIVYFLASSTYVGDRKLMLGNWLELYHNTLVNELATYGYSSDIYNYDEFLKDIDCLWPFALEVGVFHAQVRITVPWKQNINHNFALKLWLRFGL